MSDDLFRVRLDVRAYELDLNGHVTGAVYVQFADHARWQCVRDAGIRHEAMLAAGVGPVNLETKIQFIKELRAGDAVDVSCRFIWGEGKTFGVEQEFRNVAGDLVARVDSVAGLLDLTARKLVPNPRERWKALAQVPSLLGL